MLNFLKKIFGDKSVKDLKELRPIVDKIKAVEPGMNYVLKLKSLER
jgi:preprotein translocase subunit SecA